MKTEKFLTGIGAFTLAGFLAVSAPTAVLAQSAATGVEYEQDGAKTERITFPDQRAVRFCEFFFIKAKGDKVEVHIYNPTGLNEAPTTRDSCPDSLVNKFDLEAVKTKYKLDTLYFNKPRFWMFDELKMTVGAVRNIDGMDFYWMVGQAMPKDMKLEPGFLTWKPTPVPKASEITYRKGKPVFLLDDPEGKPWIMKAFRDSYGQTYDNLKDLGSRYKQIPAGWKFRVAVLERDLVISPLGKGIISRVLQDEFENTFDYLGDGSSNFVP